MTETTMDAVEAGKEQVVHLARYLHEKADGLKQTMAAYDDLDEALDRLIAAAEQRGREIERSYMEDFIRGELATRTIDKGITDEIRRQTARADAAESKAARLERELGQIVGVILAVDSHDCPAWPLAKSLQAGLDATQGEVR